MLNAEKVARTVDNESFNLDTLVKILNMTLEHMDSDQSDVQQAEPELRKNWAARFTQRTRDVYIPILTLICYQLRDLNDTLQAALDGGEQDE